MDITNDILNNREKYPDGQEITLVDGTKITVGEFRNQLQPRSEFTRASTEWSRKEKQLTGAVEGLQGQLQDLQGQLRTALETKKREIPPEPGRGPSDEELLADPVLGGIVRKLNAIQGQYDEALKKVTAHEERLQDHESTWLKRDYMDQLGRISTYHNGRFNRDGKGKAFDQAAFIDFVTTRAKINPAFANDLGLAYNEYSRADEMSTVAREAEERGREAGRKEALVPRIPNGRRNTPPRDPGLPSSLQELTDDQVLADPDIQAALQGPAE